MSKITKIPFGKTKDGEDITLFQIKNSAGSYVEILDYDCTLLGMYVHERNGHLRNVICTNALSFDDENAICNANGVIVGGNHAVQLNKRIWRSSEGEDDSVVLETEESNEEYSLKASVRFRMKDYDRLVIDYAMNMNKVGNAFLTHRVRFCLDDGKATQTHLMRNFAPEKAGQINEQKKQSFSMEYVPISEGKVVYVEATKEIHPYVELVSGNNELALTAYSTMPAMEMDTTEGFVTFSAEYPAEVAESQQNSRTVYGIDLLYHDTGSKAGNPFAFFMG